MTSADLQSLIRQPIPVYTHARLQSGEVVRLPKQCECQTHTGPHFLHSDRSWKEANRRLLTDPVNLLGMMGYAQEEQARLANLRYELQSRGIAQLLTEEQAAAQPVAA